MSDAAAARRVALGLPEAVEQSHHGFPSFRVRGKIFATLPEPDRLNVMCDESGVREAVAEYPETCAEQWWGKRLSAVRVDLANADERLLTELLTDAWRHKAPRALVARFDSGG
ncbi:MmcQ/YjbR family DNA-binding protein [Nocardia sp. NPDC004068]|uniref:MmcQ/YjbR family DNA-binding protein n=1 Tax=Nocardia sp. NPDC004068 TaxID=3364303 RepID=UPI0036B19A79